MSYIISTIELALLIVFPLIVFYQKVDSTLKIKIVSIIGLYIIWFLSYAFLHELSHLFGSWIMGTSISDYQLIPQFWKGDFKTAYVNSHFENLSQASVSLIMPYLRDIFFLFIGFWIFKRNIIKKILFRGLVIMLFILSPFYDIINNYSGYLIMSFGDFKELSNAIGFFYTNLLGAIFVATSVYIALKTYLNIRTNNLKPEL